MDTTGKVIKCKAAVAWEPNKPLVIEEIEVAPPQANEVRVKIVATAVCHTDLYHLYEGMHKDGFPVVLGHEAAGIVESVGSGVTEFKPGDKVLPLFLAQCRECKLCLSPKTNQCVKAWSEVRMDAMSPVDSRFSCKGKKILQFCGTSTFSEYTVVRQINLAKIHPDAPLDKVCLIGSRPVDLISGRTWKGSLFGGFKSKDGVTDMVQRYMDKKLMVDEFITHNMDLGQIMEAVELMKKAQCVRAVLKTSSQ
uniref:Alcohol dehydrogenase-like N-terminal domain-containing protein n=1 Tax=Knipowitschia caucasica TaxID=637954 RepID=A0AAV2JDE2_KNICA